MKNIFLNAAIISIIYFIVKLVEMRTIEKEIKPLKILIKDSLITFFSIVIGYFILEQISPIIEENGSTTIRSPTVFTDNPEF